MRVCCEGVCCGWQFDTSLPITQFVVGVVMCKDEFLITRRPPTGKDCM